MSDPLLDKMDALLKKHQGTAEPPPSTPLPAAELFAPPPLPDDAWLPVLTDVVAVGEPEAVAAPVEQAPVPPAAAIDADALAEQIMDELAPRLGSLLHDRLLGEIRNSLDDNLSSLIEQMDLHIREIVREAVAEQLANR